MLNVSEVHENMTTWSSIDCCDVIRFDGHDPALSCCTHDGPSSWHSREQQKYVEATGTEIGPHTIFANF